MKLHARKCWKNTVLAAMVSTAIAPCTSQAHPHILIQARSEMGFDSQGQLTSITDIWDFDDAFSAYAIQGYDRKGDGKPTRENLQPLAEINIKSLAEYNYFTRLKIDGDLVTFAKPRDYFDVFDNETLTLHFTLPTSKPINVGGKAIELDVYDPEYFAAITFAKNKPINLIGTNTECDSVIHRPDPLDPAIASQLAVIPPDQRTLPPELFAITDKLVNAGMVTCR